MALLASISTAGARAASPAPIAAGASLRVGAEQVGAPGGAGDGLSLPPCTVFVSPSGWHGSRGREPGSPTALDAAIARVRPGSVVCLEAGTYYARANIIIRRSGTRRRPIVIRGYGGQPLIRYVGGSLTGGVLQTASGPGWHGAHNIVIEGLEVDGGDLIGGGIWVTLGSYGVTIRNCTVFDTGAVGISLSATDYVTVVHNLIYHAGYNQGGSSGISLWYGGPMPTYGGDTAWYGHAPGFHNVIADNVISGSYDNSSAHSDGNGIIVDGAGSIPPVLIANNLVYENGGRGIEDSRNRGDVWIVNNTAYADGLDLTIGAGQAPEFAAIDASHVHFVNDLAYGRKNGGSYQTAWVYNNTHSKISWSHDVGFDGVTIGVSKPVIHNRADYRYANPMFTSPPPVPGGAAPWAAATPPWAIGDDFMLQAKSPALRAGGTIRHATAALAVVLREFLSAVL